MTRAVKVSHTLWSALGVGITNVSLYTLARCSLVDVFTVCISSTWTGVAGVCHLCISDHLWLGERGAGGGSQSEEGGDNESLK